MVVLGTGAGTGESGREGSHGHSRGSQQRSRSGAASAKRLDSSGDVLVYSLPQGTPSRARGIQGS